MKPLLALALSILVSPLASSQDIEFADYFEDATMRVDYCHSANATCDEIAIDQIYVSNIWAGNPTQLFPPMENGRYAIKLFDADSNKLIFRRHYLDIVFEYKGVETAQEGRKRTYHQTALIPCPKRAVRFTIERRERDHQLETVFSQIIDPGDKCVKREPASSMDESFVLLKNGHPHHCVDLVFLAEGYRKEELDKFREDAKRFVDYLFSIEPYASMKQRFNVQAVFRASAQSGVDIPARQIYKNTVMDVSYDTFGSSIYATVYDNRTMRDIAGKCVRLDRRWEICYKVVACRRFSYFDSVFGRRAMEGRMCPDGMTREKFEAAQSLFEESREAAADELWNMCCLMAGKEDHEMFGEAEFQMRDILLRIGAKTMENAVNARRKKGAT